MKIKIYSDPDYLPDGVAPVELLYPFWGKPEEDSRFPTSGRYDRYAEVGTAFFEVTSLEDADLAILPVSWQHVVRDSEARGLAEEFVSNVKRAGKKVVVFFWSDSTEEVPLDNAIVFRTSLYRSPKKYNEFAMPAWSEDFVERYLGNCVSLRPKRLKPVVGFCGYPGRQKKQSISRKIKQRIKGAVKGIPFSNTGPIVRARSLQHLSESPLVETNFVIRDRFMGGASLPDGTPNFPAMQELRQEYVHDMMNSDYILCARGGGNFSYRLYETLCCGRIPVFIDTNCVLPYESEINWHDYCVWIDEKQIDSIGKRVADFHNRLTVEAFTELQQKCRMLWEDWLSPEGFFGNFYRNFSEISNVY